MKYIQQSNIDNSNNTNISKKMFKVFKKRLSSFKQNLISNYLGSSTESKIQKDENLRNTKEFKILSSHKHFKNIFCIQKFIYSLNTFDSIENYNDKENYEDHSQFSRRRWKKDSFLLSIKTNLMNFYIETFFNLILVNLKRKEINDYRNVFFGVNIVKTRKFLSLTLQEILDKYFSIYKEGFINPRSIPMNQTLHMFYTSYYMKSEYFKEFLLKKKEKYGEFYGKVLKNQSETFLEFFLNKKN